MFAWISWRGNYAVHIKTVLCLAEVLVNRVIFHKRIQLYLVLKMNTIRKCSTGFLEEETTHYAVQIKTVLRLAEVLSNRVISNKRSKLYLVLKNEYD